MSHTTFDLARAHQRELRVGVEQSRRSARVAAVRRWERRSARLSRRAARVARRADRAAGRARTYARAV